jgi:hypothetical protein
MLKEGEKEKPAKNFNKEAKFYLNICLSDSVCGPMNKDGNMIKDLKNAREIQNVPYSLG